MKFLCVCEGGNVRSQALAYLLHDHYAQEAIAVGWRRIGADTMSMLCRWADRIIVMQAHFIEHIPLKYTQKVRVVDVGVDRYGIYVHPELLSYLQGVTADWQKREFQI